MDGVASDEIHMIFKYYPAIITISSAHLFCPFDLIQLKQHAFEIRGNVCTMQINRSQKLRAISVLTDIFIAPVSRWLVRRTHRRLQHAALHLLLIFVPYLFQRHQTVLPVFLQDGSLALSGGIFVEVVGVGEGALLGQLVEFAGKTQEEGRWGHAGLG